jgi:hypothetical protein
MIEGIAQTEPDDSRDAATIRVAVPSEIPSPRPCDWSLLTRPTAPNAIATHVVEIRTESDASADGTPALEIWVDGRCVHAQLSATDERTLTIRFEPRDEDS